MKASQKKRLQRKAIKAASASQDVIFAASSLEIIEASDKAQAPTIKLNAYSGGKIRLPNFPHPVVIDTSGVKAMGQDQLPILRDHDQKRPLGHGSPIIEASQLRHEGVLSHPGKERESVIEAQHGGFKWQASVGGSIPNRVRDVQLVPLNQSRVINGRKHEGPFLHVKAFLWKETSVVALGADEDRASASVAAAHNPKREVLMNEFEKWLAANGINAEGLTDAQIENLKAAYEAHEAAIQAAGGGSDTGGKGTGGKGTGGKGTGGKGGKGGTKVKASGAGGFDEDADTEEDVLSSLRHEHLRLRKVDQIFASYAGALEADKAEKLREQVILGEVSLDRAQLQLLQAARAKPQDEGMATGSRPEEALVLEAALSLNYGLPEKEVEAGLKRVDDATRQRVMNEAQSERYRRVGLKSIIRAACRQAGHSMWHDDIGSEEIRIALEHSQKVQAAGGGSAFSTISVPGILGGAARRTMLAAYNETDRAAVITRIASITTAGDFKKFERWRMTESGGFLRVPATGEVKHGKVLEESYENQVETFGRLFALSRQMMINDDLGAFLQVPRMLGRMGRTSLEEIGIETLVNAPTAEGAGTTEFFHSAARGNQAPNYLEGADTALSSTSLEQAYQLFLNQKGANGKPILMNPAVLLTTVNNAILAQRLYTETGYAMPAADGGFITNQWKGMFRPEVSQYLGVLGDNPNPLQWYLLAEATEDVGIIQLAFLNGVRNPVIEQGVMDLNVLGVTWRGVFDFGFALMDPRAGVKVEGEENPAV